MKKWLLAIAVCFTAGAGWILWDEFGPCQPGINARNFRRLHQRMSEQEVQEILGQEGKYLFGWTASQTLGWEGEEGELWIEFSFGARRGSFKGKNGVVRELRPEPEDWWNGFNAVNNLLVRWVSPGAP